MVHVCTLVVAIVLIVGSLYYTSFVQAIVIFSNLMIMLKFVNLHIQNMCELNMQ